MREVRLRFAPSPTGALHIGGLRTALYNYLLARKMGGRFILRIEDTDQTRFVPGAEEYIIECLRWSGLVPDEGVGFGGDCGPYRQSERSSIYRGEVQRLLDSGHAYYAFDSAEELEVMRSRFATEQNKMPKYDFNTRVHMRNSLTMPEAEVQSLLQSGAPHVIRLLVPRDEHVEIQDIIRGRVVFHTEELDDKVLIKSDGLPTYHLANVVDDRLMRISHVVRGEEWLSSTAHHRLLYRYFGWEDGMPLFAHLPLILKPDGQGKLSKRDGAKFGFPVFPLDWKDGGEMLPGFRERGFMPEAVLNFLALLGWNPGTEQEIFSLEEMTQLFSLEQISKSGARFDFEKAKWFNAQYIQKSDSAVIAGAIAGIFRQQKHEISMESALTIHALYKDRVQLLNEFFEQGRYVVSEDFRYQEDYMNKKWKAEWRDAYDVLKERLKNAEDWNREALEPMLKQFMEDYAFKMGEVLPALRVMLSGVPMGPDIYAMLVALGRESCVRRIGKFIVQ